ncbi:glycosyltransferase family 2 protein [Lactiplantibacillus plantarum]|uniref:glycosyltransferase family 2 protein n=1 Tax=Lactiplantibacillus plantarum TaxID=1590 RepID=UPI0021A7FFC4|nr:glycosyltransferase family 2 protein [Lactiplantibacillus plantarum]MCT3212945.1 glycosyltransferase family 2 protein [Lactiplantibacillus plantarum]MCT3269220.1 glycosyltransferase family 2 protein [Lactiplantibacillus plantarum]
MIKFKERGNVSFSNFRLKEHQCDYEPIIGLIMVKNQERRILQTLESIVNICDQIIMVDTGSSDNIVAIVESNYNSVLIKHVDWKEDYAAMRNKCLTFVPNDTWVLFVDSDEIFSKEYNSEEIKSFLYEVDKRFPNQDKICTVKQMQPDRPTYVRPERFVKKTETLYYFGYVHEEPRTKRTEKLVKIDTDLELMNNGLTKGEYAKFNKQQRYAMLLKKNIALEPDNPRWTSLISPIDIQLGLFEHDKYVEKLKKEILKDIHGDITENNVKQGEYLNYLLERYCIELVHSENMELASKYIKFSKKKFPYDVTFIVLEMTIFFTSLEQASLRELKKIIDFTNNTDFNIIDSESEGSEDALSAVVIKLLLLVEKFDQAKAVYKTISDPIAKELLNDEKKILES